MLRLSVSASIFYSVWRNKPTPAIENEEVVSIEERCTNLDNPLMFVGGKHSFLLVTTKSGRKVRYDYTEDNPLPQRISDYFDLDTSELFRSASVLPGITVKEVDRLLRSSCLKKEYHVFTHNCQTVSRDVFNTLSGFREQALRNDYLLAFMREISSYDRSFLRFEDEDANFIDSDFLPNVSKVLSPITSEKLRGIRRRLKTDDLVRDIRTIDRILAELQDEDEDFQKALVEMESLLKGRLNLCH